MMTKAQIRSSSTYATDVEFSKAFKDFFDKLNGEAHLFVFDADIEEQMQNFNCKIIIMGNPLLCIFDKADNNIRSS